MRPKHTLWLLVVLLSATWYFVDPQARPGTASLRPLEADRDDRIVGFQISSPAPKVAATQPPF